MLLDWKNIVKMTQLPKANYRFNANPIKLPVAFFHTIKTKFYNFMETQTTMNSPSNLQKKKKKKRAGGNMLPDFRLYYRATVIKTV